MSAPVLSPGLFVCPGEGGLLAYDPLTDQVHRLNPLGSLICELCDGSRGLEEIEAILAPMLPAGEEGAVAGFIAQAMEAGVLARAPARLPKPDVVPLVKRLREQDKLEAAFICQYHAAEQDPRDAQHWAALGELSHILGRRGQARTAYERYLSLRPYDAEIRHLLTALRDQPPPPRAADDCIQQLYERFAPFYERNMLEELDYQAPKRLAALIAEVMAGRGDLHALELGCGTGLAGIEIRPRCARLTGIDLSAHMLERARERRVYDVLEQAEIGAWLRESGPSFDLILACDSLIYFGELSDVLSGAAARLEPDGLFVFSLERGEQAPYRLNDNGRYSHHPDSLRALVAETGFQLLRLEEGYLRMEYGQSVSGLFVALRVSTRFERTAPDSALEPPGQR